MSNNLVDVLIANYRTPDLSIKAAQSVLKDESVNSVIIVDDNSPDLSCQTLRDKASVSEKIKIICSDKNSGFGASNNTAAKAATAPYIFLLNSDAEVFEGELSGLISVLEEQKQVGMISPYVYLPDKKTMQKDAQGIFPTAWRLIFRKTRNYTFSKQPDWISGVSFMVRRDEFLRLGGFDERYFMYFEDIDLCWRYRQEGLMVSVSDVVKIMHLGGASQKSSSKQKKRYDKSQDMFLKKIGTGFVLRIAVKIVRSIFRLTR